MDNGRKIRVFEDPWIPRPATFKPITKQGTGGERIRVPITKQGTGRERMMVSELLDNQNGGWMREIGCFQYGQVIGWLCLV